MKIVLRTTDKRTIFLKFLFIALVLYILLVCSIFPFEWFQNLTGGPVCLFKRITGRSCLFCGITSSLLNSFKFNLKEAFLQNPGGVFVFFAFIFVSINTVLEAFFKKRILFLLSKRTKTISAIGIIILLLANWVFKLIKEAL